jgi:hypothetical protein
MDTDSSMHDEAGVINTSMQESSLNHSNMFNNPNNPQLSGSAHNSNSAVNSVEQDNSYRSGHDNQSTTGSSAIASNNTSDNYESVVVKREPGLYAASGDYSNSLLYNPDTLANPNIPLTYAQRHTEFVRMIEEANNILYSPDMNLLQQLEEARYFIGKALQWETDTQTLFPDELTSGRGEARAATASEHNRSIFSNIPQLHTAPARRIYSNNPLESTGNALNNLENAGDEYEEESGEELTANDANSGQAGTRGKLPFIILTGRVQKQFTVSRKEAKLMSDEEKTELITVPVRIMGTANRNNMYILARDILLLAHIRVTSTSKNIVHLDPDEVARIPILTQRANGRMTQVQCVVTISGAKRMLDTITTSLGPHAKAWLMSEIDNILKHAPEINKNIQEINQGMRKQITNCGYQQFSEYISTTGKTYLNRHNKFSNKHYLEEGQSEEEKIIHKENSVIEGHLSEQVPVPAIIPSEGPSQQQAKRYKKIKYKHTKTSNADNSHHIENLGTGTILHTNDSGALNNNGAEAAEQDFSAHHAATENAAGNMFSDPATAQQAYAQYYSNPEAAAAYQQYYAQYASSMMDPAAMANMYAAMGPYYGGGYPPTAEALANANPSANINSNAANDSNPDSNPDSHPTENAMPADTVIDRQ